MRNIDQLSKELELLDETSAQQRRDLTDQLQAAYDKVFDSDVALQKAVAELEDAEDFGMDDCGVYRWARFYTDVADDAVEYLQNYLQHRGVDFDHENGALHYYTGPAIIINDKGDVLDEDSGKWVINHKDCKIRGELCRHKRAYLIEQYMEKSGCFPGVFRCDRYGNIFIEPTQELAKQYNPETDEEV